MYTKRIHGGRNRMPGTIDFSVNTNPFMPLGEIYRIIKEHVELVRFYPEEHSHTLCNKISKKYHIPPEGIIIGNGAGELIFLFIRTLKPKRVILPVPSFPEYWFSSKIVTDDIKLIQYKKGEYVFSYNIDDILRHVIENSLVIIGNPNNPTGHLFDKFELMDMAKKLKEKESYLFIDEAFIDFTEKCESVTLLYETMNFPNIFVLRSFTKMFSIPGLRLGFGVGWPAAIDKMELSRDPWSCNILAQTVGAYILDIKKEIDKTRENVKKERDFLYNSLKEMPCFGPYKSSANFMLAEDTKNSMEELETILSKKQIIIRNATHFPGLSGEFFRIAIRTHSDNIKLIDTLALNCL